MPVPKDCLLFALSIFTAVIVCIAFVVSGLQQFFIHLKPGILWKRVDLDSKGHRSYRLCRDGVYGQRI